jgi:peptide/nickel transport system permease protein
VTIWLVTSLVFFAIRLTHIDPVSALLSQGLATPAQASALRASLGLDRPLWQQYLDFLGGILRGDLGRSLFSDQPVGETIVSGLRFTAPLAATAWGLAVLLGLVVGSLASRSRAAEAGSLMRLAARVLNALLALGTATPVTWSGLLILWAAVPLLANATSGFARDLLSLLLPALTLALASGSSLGRVTQAGLFSARTEQFHLAARARGVPPGWRLEWQALRTTLAPVISLSGVEAAFLLGGTMVTETLFSRPGLGRVLVEAILRGDYPLVQAVVAVAAAGYALFNLLADVVAAWLDPRLREESQ